MKEKPVDGIEALPQDLPVPGWEETRKGILIGICGGSGSGKTLVARNLIEGMGGHKQVGLIQQDMYYKDLVHIPFEERVKMNYDHPDAFDNDLLYSHLRDLLAGGVIDHPQYDFKNHIRMKKRMKVGPHKIIIVEGILIFIDPRVRGLMDIKVFVDNDPDIRFIRRLRRDISERGRTVENVVDQYEKTVRPSFLQFIEPAKRYADLIIPGGGHNHVAIDLLMTKIRALVE